MSSHGHTVRQPTNIPHHRKILLLLDLSVAFLFLSPLIDASEKKDIIKRKGRGSGREKWGGGGGGDCFLLPGNVSPGRYVCGCRCVREHLYRLM